MAAAKRQAGDTGFRHDAERHGESEGLGLAVDVADGGAAAGAHPPRRDVDAHRVHGAKVDDDAAVAHRIAGDVVTAAAHRDRHAVGTGEVDGIDDVGDAAAAGNDGRMLVDADVQDHARVIVSSVTRREAGAAHSSDERRDGLVVYGCLDDMIF